MSRRRVPRVEVDATSVIRNLEALQARAAVPIAAVLKANAYGHGLELIARLLHERVNLLAVAELDEAIQLETLGMGPRTLLMGPAPVDAYPDLAQAGITITVSSLEACAALADLPPSRRPRAHLHVDTGLHRLGLVPRDVPRAARVLRDGQVHLQGLFIHPARADAGDWGNVEDEIAQCAEAGRVLKRAGVPVGLVHHGGSSLLIERPDLVGDLGRPGIALYGHHPARRQRPLVQLRPTLRLVAAIVEVRALSRGERVGYGNAGVFPSDGVLATIGIGVSHGLDARTSRGGAVRLNGCRAPYVGSIALDYATIDVSGIEARPGDEVVVYGGEPEEPTSVQRIAELTGTIVDHVFCRISSRLPRAAVRPV